MGGRDEEIQGGTRRDGRDEEGRGGTIRDEEIRGGTRRDEGARGGTRRRNEKGGRLTSLGLIPWCPFLLYTGKYFDIFSLRALTSSKGTQ
jgi:hypothetical protein